VFLSFSPSTSLVPTPALEALVLVDELLRVHLGGIVVLLLIVGVLRHVGGVVQVHTDRHGREAEEKGGHKRVAHRPLVRGVKPTAGMRWREQVRRGVTTRDKSAAKHNEAGERKTRSFLYYRSEEKH
jgi:hypothetical protein